ncbi:hypothetical protein MTO96_051471 [Rhipicephalus appendiculatus]
MAGKLLKWTFHKVSAEASDVILCGYYWSRARPSSAFTLHKLCITKGLSTTLLGRNWIKLCIKLCSPAGGESEEETGCIFLAQLARLLFQYGAKLHDIADRDPCQLLLSRRIEALMDLLYLHLRFTALLSQLSRNWLLTEGAVAHLRRRRERRSSCPGPPWPAGQVTSPAYASSLLLLHIPNETTRHRHADHVRARLGTQIVHPAAI